MSLRAVIATFDDAPPIGGQGRYVIGLRDALRRRGVEVRTVAGHGDHAVPVPRITGRPPLDHSIALTRDPRPLLSPRPDVVHVMGGPGGVLLPRRLDVPVVYTAHHTYRQAYSRSSPRRAISPVEARSYRLAASVLAVSPSTADAVLSLGVPPDRVEVLPPGIDIPPLDEVLPDRDPGYVLFVGRLEAEKRPLDAVWVMGELARRHPGMHGTVIGQGRLDHAVRQAAASAPAGTVEVRGGVSEKELRRAYARASILLVTSRYEGLGLVALEAMAAGVMVVAYNVSGLRDAVGGVGCLVPAGDRRGMARACAQLVEVPGRRDFLASRAADLVRARHSWETVAVRVEQVYRSL
jgi:glycosyltransferase involved in cell wall biosynthesis